MDYGFTPGAGATWVLAEKMGPDLARESLLTARHYAGRELKERGLALRVLPRTGVVAAAMALGERMVRAPRARLIGLKRQLTAPFIRALRDLRLNAMHDQTLSPTDAWRKREKFLQDREPAPHTSGPSSSRARLSTTTCCGPHRGAQDLRNELQMRESDVDETQFVYPAWIDRRLDVGPKINEK